MLDQLLDVVRRPMKALVLGKVVALVTALSIDDEADEAEVALRDACDFVALTLPEGDEPTEGDDPPRDLRADALTIKAILDMPGVVPEDQVESANAMLAALHEVVGVPEPAKAKASSGGGGRLTSRKRVTTQVNDKVIGSEPKGGPEGTVQYSSLYYAGACDPLCHHYLAEHDAVGIGKVARLEGTGVPWKDIRLTLTGANGNSKGATEAFANGVHTWTHMGDVIQVTIEDA